MYVSSLINNTKSKVYKKFIAKHIVFHNVLLYMYVLICVVLVTSYFRF